VIVGVNGDTRSRSCFRSSRFGLLRRDDPDDADFGSCLPLRGTGNPLDVLPDDAPAHVGCLIEVRISGHLGGANEKREDRSNDGFWCRVTPTITRTWLINV